MALGNEASRGIMGDAGGLRPLPRPLEILLNGPLRRRALSYTRNGSRLRSEVSPSRGYGEPGGQPPAQRGLRPSGSGKSASGQEGLRPGGRLEKKMFRDK